MDKKTALITGLTGQDGSYLAEFLLSKGYIVHGIVRRSSCLNRFRIDHLISDKEIFNKTFFMHYGDLTDPVSLAKIVKDVQPDEIYNLAAQSHVKISFEIPQITANVNAIGVLNLLEIIQALNLQKKTKIYQAATSELFGKVSETPQTEKTPFYPRSPYGIAKQYAFWITKNYREAYGMFICNGILFNHESPRRGVNFITRKITTGLSMVKLGQKSFIEVGNMDARRDWGYAPEYVESMWLMLQQENPEDYVIATGETHTVREFIEEVSKVLGYNLEWKGSGLDEVGVDRNTGKTIIKVSKKYFRPTEVDVLLGDATKAKEKLGWVPQIKFKELAELMAKKDYELLKEGPEKITY